MQKDKMKSAQQNKSKQVIRMRALCIDFISGLDFLFETWSSESRAHIYDAYTDEKPCTNCSSA